MPWIYSPSSCFCVTAFVPAACIESQRTVCAISNQMCFYWVHFWMSAGTAFLVSPLAPQICSENGSGARLWEGTLGHVWLWADFRVWACVRRAVWNCRDLCSVFRASYNIGASFLFDVTMGFFSFESDWRKTGNASNLHRLHEHHSSMCQEHDF